jgi:hypothetical protein
MSPVKPIQIELSGDEALILFDWLTRTEGTLPIADRAEQTVLWRIEGQLEIALSEPLAPDYSQLLDAARARINDAT